MESFGIVAETRRAPQPQARDFAELYREDAGWLVARLRRRLGDTAEDVVQEAYAAIAASGIQPRHPRALLLTISRNLAHNHERSKRRENLALADAGRRVVSVEQAGQGDAALLKAIILGLPEPLRDVFLLSRYHGLNTAEIGLRLGIPAKTAEDRLTRALAHCAAQLRR